MMSILYREALPTGPAPHHCQQFCLHSDTWVKLVRQLAACQDTERQTPTSAIEETGCYLSVAAGEGTQADPGSLETETPPSHTNVSGHVARLSLGEM